MLVVITMLRYQASMFDQTDNGEVENFHNVSQPSTIESANGLRVQQSRFIRRQPTSSYKSMTTCRLAPRRRYFVMDSQKSSSNNSTAVMFPGPDYFKRMKENYESGKVIYIKRNIPSLKNSSANSRTPSTITNSIRSATYHMSTGSIGDNSTIDSNVSKNKSNNNLYVPTFEPLKIQYTTVPPCLSMGGEYVYEEEVDIEDESLDSGCGLSIIDNDDNTNQQGFNSSPTSELIVPKEENDYLKSSGPLVLPSSINCSATSSSSGTPSPVTMSHNNSSKLMSNRNRLQPTKFTCPQDDCYWRGPSEVALRKHMQIHGKQPLSYQSNKNSGDPMKVQLVQPKPKGVKCSECDTFAYSRPLLLRHMHDAHGIEAPLIRRTFANREMLQTWLDSLRETHAVEFVVSSGSKKWGRGLQVHYLTCSRSGDQKERPNKKYVRPPRPSIKCGRNCMAYLKIKQNPTVSELQIEGCLHHSGHEIDHTRMMLEENELVSIGCIVDVMNEGNSDILRNVEAMRQYLGSSGRFRLVSDQGLIDQMPTWIDQYHRALSDYVDDSGQPGLMRHDGIDPQNYNNNFCTSGPLTHTTMRKSPASSVRRYKFTNSLFNKDIKNENVGFGYKKSVPIRFSTNSQNNDYQVQNLNGNGLMGFDETKVKQELEDEDTLAAQNLLKIDFDEIKPELLESPMIGGDERSMDDDILCAGDDAAGITANSDNLMTTTSFNDEACNVDNINTEFFSGMDDEEFNELLRFTDFSSSSC